MGKWDKYLTSEPLLARENAYVLVKWPDSKPGLIFGIVHSKKVIYEVACGIYSMVSRDDLREGRNYTIYLFNEYIKECEILQFGSLQTCNSRLTEVLNEYFWPHMRVNKRRRLL